MYNWNFKLGFTRIFTNMKIAFEVIVQGRMKVSPLSLSLSLSPAFSYLSVKWTCYEWRPLVTGLSTCDCGQLTFTQFSIHSEKFRALNKAAGNEAVVTIPVLHSTFSILLIHDRNCSELSGQEIHVNVVVQLHRPGISLIRWNMNLWVKTIVKVSFQNVRMFKGPY